MSSLDLRRARVSAGDMAYADEGDGPAVLLLHGLPTSSHLWRDLVPMLSVRFRAIAPDLLGYGASDKPSGADLRIEAQAGYVRELLAQLGVERFAVVGHDIGGGIAQLLALDPGVEAIALVDAIAFDAWPVDGVRRLQAKETVDAALAERFVRASFDLGMRRPLAEDDLRAYLDPWLADPLALLRAARALDGRALLDMRSIEVPSFVLWGEDDPFLPASVAERLWEILPEAGVALLPGCGHFVTEDAPETALPILAQFLRNRYLGQAGHDHAGGPVPVNLGVSFDRPPPDAGLEDE
ncbi:MAG TPA: alpha/beta fold hydrolase [Actinomycetota bacterium]